MHHEWHYRDPFWGDWYPGYAGNYDSNYSYTPTPEQATTAQKRVKDYLVAVQKRQAARCYSPLYRGRNAKADEEATRRLPKKTGGREISGGLRRDPNVKSLGASKPTPLRHGI